MRLLDKLLNLFGKQKCWAEGKESYGGKVTPCGGPVKMRDEPIPETLCDVHQKEAVDSMKVLHERFDEEVK